MLRTADIALRSPIKYEASPTIDTVSPMPSRPHLCPSRGTHRLATSTKVVSVGDALALAAATAALIWVDARAVHVEAQ